MHTNVALGILEMPIYDLVVDCDKKHNKCKDQQCKQKRNKNNLKYKAFATSIGFKVVKVIYNYKFLWYL